MATESLPILPGTLPPGVCYPDEQTRLVAFAENMSAQLDGSAYYNYGSTQPSVENQGYPWLNTNDGRWYTFVGRWRTPSNYSTGERRWWAGSLADLVTYDGGESGDPMWEEDTDFQGRSPMGPGAIPSANPSKTLTVGENYGEGAHTMTEAELVEHTHEPPEGIANYIGYVEAGQPSSYEATGGTEMMTFGETAATGDGEAMPIIHPVRGLYCIKWTGKQFRYAS